MSHREYRQPVREKGMSRKDRKAVQKMIAFQRQQHRDIEGLRRLWRERELVNVFAFTFSGIPLFAGHL